MASALANRYRIERELGTGGMAIVYLAHDQKHDRKVALKVLKPELAAAIGADRFLAEIRTTAGLQHPHILPLFDSGQAGDALFYVMPYVEGETLRDRLVREPRLPVEDAIRIATAIASALDHAHRRGGVHRDVKPENILLSDGHAIVADFGIARAIDKSARGRLTGTGIVLGTVAYMSPEQAVGDQDVDGRSDLYSLGVVTYEMLAGEPPFSGPTVQAIVAKTLAVPPPPIQALRPELPAAVAAAVNKSLAKTPQDRFDSGAQFAAALVKSPGVTTKPLGARRIAAVVGLLALGIVAALTVRRAGSDARGTRPAPSAASIAVLPFVTIGGDSTTDYFGEGMAEELISTLGSVPGLRVVLCFPRTVDGIEHDFKVIGDGNTNHSALRSSGRVNGALHSVPVSTQECQEGGAGNGHLDSMALALQSYSNDSIPLI